MFFIFSQTFSTIRSSSFILLLCFRLFLTCLYNFHPENKSLDFSISIICKISMSSLSLSFKSDISCFSLSSASIRISLHFPNFSTQRVILSDGIYTSFLSSSMVLFFFLCLNIWQSYNFKFPLS